MKPSKFVNLLISVFAVLALVSTAEAAKKKKGKAAAATPAAEAAEPAPQESAPPPPAAEPEPAPKAARANAPVEEATNTGASMTMGGSNYATRRFVLNKGQLRIDGGPADFTLRNLDQGLSFVKSGKGADLGVTLGAGAAYGITDELEVGAVVLPLFVSPEFALRDIPVYGRYLLSDSGDTQIAAQALIDLPTGSKEKGTGGYFGLAAGVALRHRLNETMIFDGAAQVGADFITDNTQAFINVPLVLNYLVTPEAFVGLRTGFNFTDKRPEGKIDIPLGFQGGYTLLDGKLDALAFFGFDRLLTPDAPANVDKFSLNFWSLGFGALYYLDTASN